LRAIDRPDNDHENGNHHTTLATGVLDMNTLDAFAWIAVIPISLIFMIFVNEIALGLAPIDNQFGVDGRPRATTILIPAHNEASGIGETLLQLTEMLPNVTKILVVADNCTDDTADIARACGAEVIERNDIEKRGKGFALDFGRTHLSIAPPDCVVILDADCLPDIGTIETLSAAAIESGRPVQAINLMHAGPDAGPLVEISNFAFLIKNLVRQRGLVRSGGPAMLTGTGMAFPWAIYRSLALASSNIVEDLAITVDLTLKKSKPMLVEGARVWSEAATADDTLTQRTRWEHGFVATARKHAIPALVFGILNRQLGPLRLGLHLLVPPLAMLIAIGGAVAIFALILSALGASPVPAIILFAMIALSLLLLAIAWWREGRSVLSARAIIRVPSYVLWKIPVYLKLIKGPETEWIRTNRQD
jgi:cellulose synthase/poly-beta-1,6-N-acetylglucosamine synthase-like glycosyltransferase